MEIAGFHSYKETPSCWRKAKISRLRWYREEKKALTKVRSPDIKGVMGLDLYHRMATFIRL